MKLYRVRLVKDDLCEQAWATSYADARRIARVMRESLCTVDRAIINRVDVPTDKGGLTDWLNRNFDLEPTT